MATYSEMTFNSQHYDDSRPNYPQPFYKELIKYHTKKVTLNWQLILDVVQVLLLFS